MESQKMLLDLRAERRPGLLGRSDTLALLEIYVEKAVKQLHIAVPIVTGPERTVPRASILLAAALAEVSKRTEIIRRRCGVSMASSVRFRSARLRGLVRTKS